MSVLAGVVLLADGGLEIVRVLRSHGDEGYALLALLVALAGLIFIKHPLSTIPVVLAYQDLSLRAGAVLAGVLLVVCGLALLWGGHQIRAAAMAYD